jgi:cytochrome c-type biogenesis protein CcmH
MLTFIVCAALMIAAALAFVLPPLLRQTSGAPLESARLAALEQARAAGVIDADEYATKRAALGAAAPAATRPTRATSVTILLLALLLPATALLLYRLVGTPQALDPANLVAAPATPAGVPEMEQAIAMLAARLQQQPGDAEGWALLGRAYQATQRGDEALAAFKRAHEQAPDTAGYTIEYAQALALAAPGHRIDGEARTLLEGVLQADPSNQRALWLLGISDYQAQRYDAAIARWQTLLPLLETGSEVHASVERQIAEAEALRDGKTPVDAPRTAAASAAAPTDSTANDAAAAGPAPKLTVEVALDPKLQSQLDPDATLFVFARAASGPPMPLAIQRLKAAQLPVTVTLDESMGMLPTIKLSMFPQVVVGARVSKSGNAIAQSGDLQVLSAPLDVHATQPIVLRIDQVVP